MELTKFWQEVAQAYDKVAADHSLTIDVQREGKRAMVFWSPGGIEPDTGVDAVIARIDEVPTEVKEPLISP